MVAAIVVQSTGWVLFMQNKNQTKLSSRTTELSAKKRTMPTSTSTNGSFADPMSSTMLVRPVLSRVVAMTALADQVATFAARAHLPGFSSVFSSLTRENYHRWMVDA